MECTKCHNVLSIDNFSLKNDLKMIYYSYCNLCREKVKKYKNTIKEYDNYEDKKKTNIINCACGKSYIAFREYHIIRHQNSSYHKKKNDIYM